MTNLAYTQSLNKLIEEFGRLPGMGPKTAERLAFHILKTSGAEAMALSEAIASVKQNITYCRTCFNLSESNTCQICQDTKRDKSIICVVEKPRDVISLEKTGLCKWVYHILGGHIAPLEGIEPEDLTIDKLLERIETGEIKEVIMATNPTVEGDGTALYISSLIKSSSVKITRLARGLPGGSQIEYASGTILTDAILGRSEIE
ncbi:MAG: recombination mediator RecR [Anaerohalosphaeraceae bacterium]|nr:recombination mediator RecR [Anaerohalosphaeraceae bacterium]